MLFFILSLVAIFYMYLVTLLLKHQKRKIKNKSVRKKLITDIMGVSKKVVIQENFTAKNNVSAQVSVKEFGKVFSTNVKNEEQQNDTFNPDIEIEYDETYDDVNSLSNEEINEVIAITEDNNHLAKGINYEEMNNLVKVARHKESSQEKIEEAKNTYNDVENSELYEKIYDKFKDDGFDVSAFLDKNEK